ncbi:MAG: ABC transporter permease, partial [Chloroflexi bacterium]|nr:ABC transporter permease [Chloroflexota bacterium]
MQQYILHRALLFLPTVFGISLLIFALLRVMPGDVAAAILGDERRPEVIEQVRHDLGLDKPLPQQYLEWIGGVVRGDFGQSYWYKTSVLEEIAKRYPVTLELAVLSIFFAILIAIPTGVLSAIKQDTMIDYALRIFTIGGLAIPNFWLGTLMILGLVVWFRWIPPFGYVSPTQDLWANLQQFILPSLALGYSLSAILSRMT